MKTALNATNTEVLITIRGNDNVQYPLPVKGDARKRNLKKYCLFHKDKGHDTKESYIFKK